ncbi:MAG: VOC family protein [Pseudomonadota bacterium]|nr:VOC family protein [Pseudomonadota bacterium]
MQITGLDHIVLTVTSLEETCTFYEGVLGMKRETFSGGRMALSFAGQKINLHVAGKEFTPHAAKPGAGTGDFCLIVESVMAAQARLKQHDIAIIDGPVERTGARGKLMSVYCRDPDGNLVELAEYVSV